MLFVPAVVLAQVGSAQTTAQIQYPVEWLGNCDSEQLCQDYCADVTFVDLCYEAEQTFGVSFLTQSAREAFEQSLGITTTTQSPYPIPMLDGCPTQQDCQNYCSNPSEHILCYEVELQYGIELLTQEARDIVIQTVTGGATTTSAQIQYPVEWLGNCDSEQLCQDYCADVTFVDLCYEAEQTFGVSFLTQSAREAFEQSLLGSTESEEQEQEQEAQATTGMSQIDYPIEELGFCDSAQDCQNYCDDAANYEDCLAFGVANGMYPPGPQQMAEAVLGGEGPEGCEGSTCAQVCDSTTNGQACAEFAHESGAMDEEELEATEAVLEQGGPGGCVTETQCNTYCAAPENAQECLDFAVEHGLVSEQERERVEALQQGGPGGCVGEKECHAYCSQDQNIKECMLFAQEHGLMSEEDQQHVQDLHLETLNGPGGCQSDIECYNYCSEPQHEQECLQFALDNEIEVVTQMLTTESVQSDDADTQTTDVSDVITVVDPETGKSMQVRLEDLLDEDMELSDHPAGCSTREECREYCELPENRDDCLPFSG